MDIQLLRALQEKYQFCTKAELEDWLVNNQSSIGLVNYYAGQDFMAACFDKIAENSPALAMWAEEASLLAGLEATGGVLIVNLNPPSPNEAANNELPGMPAQLLYDWRAVTGFISGMDLHDAFCAMCGDPSPSGNQRIPAELAAQFIANYLDELETTESFSAAARNYASGCDWETGNIRTLAHVEALRRNILKFDLGYLPGQFMWLAGGGENEQK